MNIDVPDTIPLSKVRAFLADLGIDVKGLRELVVGIDGVYAEVMALDAKGSPYFEGNGSVAMHRIALQLDRDA